MFWAIDRWAVVTLGAMCLAPTLGAEPAQAREKSAAAQALEANPQLKMALDTPTFRELKAKLPKFVLDGTTYYLAEGDLRLDEAGLMFYGGERDDQLRAFRDAKLPGLPGPPAPSLGELLSHTINGQVARFTPGSTLTYCVLKSTFGDQAKYQAAVDNMAAATKEWAETINLKFMHDATHDGDTPAATPPSGITFTVRFVPPGTPDAPIASAFFPGDPAADRHLLLFPDYFEPGLSFDKVGVIRHELGHVVGFRHEHIRSEAPPVCQGEPLFGAIPQTEYDPKSVMHYFCGNRGSLALQITVLDRVGARKVYGAPPATTPSAGLGAGAEPPLSALPMFARSFRDVPPR